MSEQLTLQGNTLVKILVQDIETKEELEVTWIRRAKLAKLLSEFKVVGAKDGMFIIEK